MSVRQATPADDAEVAAAHDALSTAILRGDSRGHDRKSRRFHVALAAPSRMHRLLRMFESAWNITEPLQPMSFVSADMTQRLLRPRRHPRGVFGARRGRAHRSVCAALPPPAGGAGLGAPRNRPVVLIELLC
ncbi:FCD domain-containing protein [uncultured Jatrophihabitans sp.]|uniref:FCD domain-containing protein n=1 Tax=uncultured Jatrophihabitans sp. TaxID=1610747 RepID=UPI0035CAEAA8